MFAMYCFIKKYMASDAPRQVVDECLARWIERNKKWVKDAGATPRKMMKNGGKYANTCVNTLGLDLDDVIDKIDWQCFESGGVEDEVYTSDFGTTEESMSEDDESPQA